MFRDYKLAAFAIAFILCGPAFSQDEGRMPFALTTPETAPSAIHRSVGQDKLPIPVRIIVGDDEKKAAIDLEQKTRDHDDSDLKAQWKAADAAAEGARYSKDQVEIAWWQLGLSLLGSVALIISLSLTVVSLRETKEAMRFTREIGEAQVRSYLGIDKIYFLPRKSRIEFDLKNFGQSKAINVEVNTSCFLRESGDKAQLNIPSKVGPKEYLKIAHPFGIINPEHSSKGIINIDKNPEYQRINIKFTISYIDIFGHTHVYGVDYYLTDNKSSKGMLDMHIVPNSYREGTNDSRHSKMSDATKENLDM